MPDQFDLRPVPQPGYYYPPQPPQGTDGMAVASFVLSLLWGAGVLSVLAVIFGHISLRNYKARADQNGHGLAVAGLVIGYIGLIPAIFLVVLLVIAIIASAAGAGN